MAKKSGRNRKNFGKNYGQNTGIAQRGMPKFTYRIPVLSDTNSIYDKIRRLHRETTQLAFHQDRRYWHPSGTGDPLYRDDGRPVEYKASSRESNPRIETLEDRIGFSAPLRAEVCKKRKQRRRYLFVTGKAGKGKKGPEKRRYNELSKIKC